MRTIFCWTTHFSWRKYSEEVHEDLITEEEPKIKIVEEINEDPIIEKNLEVDIVKPLKKKL